MQVGQLEIKLFAQLAQLQADMNRANSMVGSSMKQIEGAVGGAKAALGALGVGVGLGAIVAMAKHALDAAEQLNKMSQKTGISVEELSKLKYAADQGDVSMESMGKAIKKLSTEMIAAGDSTSKSGKIMSALGVDLKAGVGPALETIADTFKALPDGPEKAALAVELFGKAGLDMIPMLNQGSEGLRKMKDEAVRLGLVVSKDMAESAEKFNDTMKTLKFQSEHAAMAVTEKLLPSLIRIAEAMREASVEGGLFQKVLVALGGVMTEVIGLNDDLLERNVKYINALKDERDGLKSMAAAGAELLPGERDRLALIDREITQWEQIAAARRKAKQEEDNSPANMMQKAAEEIADSVMAKIKKSNADRIAGILSDNGAAEKAYNTLIRAINEKEEAVARELAGDIKLTDGERLLHKTQAELADGTLKLNATQKALALSKIQTLIQGEKDLDLMKRMRDMYKSLADGAEIQIKKQEEMDAAVANFNTTTSQYLKDMEFENKLLLQQATAVQGTVQQKMELEIAQQTAIELRKLEAEYIRASVGLEQEEFDTLTAIYMLSRQQLPEIIRERAELNAVIESQQNSAHAWEDLADRVIRGLRDMRGALKQWAQELATVFLKKYFLQIVAGVTGNASLATQAGQMGAGSFGGSLLDGASSFLFGSPGAVTSTGLAEPAIAGLLGEGGFTAFATETAIAAGASEAFAASIAAAIPVIGWFVAAGAILYSVFGHKGGGPKEEGSFFSSFSSTGANTGNLTGAPILSGAHGEEMQKYGDALAKSFIQTIIALGGLPTDFKLGQGYSQDPKGTAPSFVWTFLETAEGKKIFEEMNQSVGRSSEEVQAELALQWRKAIVAFVREGDFADPIKDLFATLGDDATVAEIDAVIAKAQEFNFVLQNLASVDLNGISLEAVQAMQHSGETLTQTFQRVAGEALAMNDAFLTSEQKLENSKGVLAGFYGDLEKLGMTAPANKAEWLALFKSLDLSTEAGRELHDRMVALAPTFLAVADASEQLKQQMEDDWTQAQGFLDKLLGRNGDERQMGDLVGEFEASNPWAKGKTPEQLVEAFKTITEDDFKGYSAENRKLILAILGLSVSMDAATDKIVKALVIPEVEAQTLQGQFQNTYGGLIGAQPTMSSQLGLGVQLMGGQISQWQAQQHGLSEYDPVWQTLQIAIDDFKRKIGLSVKDIAQLTIDTAKYGEPKAEQLLTLQKWYDQQKALMSGNQAALLALEDTYGKKRNDIINGNLADGIEGVKEKLGDWLNSLLTNEQLSPLDPKEQMAAAKKQFEATLAAAQGGDSAAMGALQGDAEAYLRIARDLLKSSPDYVGVFQSVFDAVAGVADVPDYNTRMLDLQSTSANTLADVRALLVKLLQDSEQHAEEVVSATTAAGERVALAVETADTQLGSR